MSGFSEDQRQYLKGSEKAFILSAKILFEGLCTLTEAFQEGRLPGNLRDVLLQEIADISINKSFSDSPMYPSYILGFKETAERIFLILRAT